jgi:lysylphosphatidylglycerol synthetase-like protein (DUF2156 family)
MTAQRKVLLPLVLIFIFINSFLFVAKNLLTKWNIDRDVVITANLIFFIVSVLVFLMQRKALANPNPHAFVRSVMGGMMLKMFVCIIAVIIYVVAAGKAYNKPAVFASLFLYLVYLVVEVAVIMKLNKRTDA